ncbi:MAG: exosortase O [Anaerolineae bacterium]|nr:exosortase O [Anaerolineae bacterium]
MSAINPPAQSKTALLKRLPRSTGLATNLALIGLWLWLYRPVFDYLAIIFSREDFRTNQLVLLGVIGLIAVQIHKGGLRPRFDAAPHLFRPGLVLALGGSVLYLLVERFLDINTLSASLFGLASYGLLGLWLTPQRWRQGLPAVLLLIGALPFGEHMQTFIGYPMRILTATIVRDGLAAVGTTSIGVDTILILENGVSQVDLPCSGVKSLWTGLLFLIAATWLERRRLNWRWLAIAFVLAGLLLAANLARVGILVLVGQVAGWRLAAEMLHVPLGVLGFIAACAAALSLLRLVVPSNGAGLEKNESANTVAPNRSLDRPRWLAPGLAAVILIMALLYVPRPHTGLTQSPPTWNFPAGLVTESMPLKADELAWFTREGAESAERWRFTWGNLSGSMMFITSHIWRAHHRPERCLEVYGLSIDDSRTHLVNPNFPLRLVLLGNGRGYPVTSAAYWFQSAGLTTDDYGARVWADLAPRRDRWILVSIVFDEAYDPHATDMQAFFTALHRSVRANLKGDSP